MLRQQRNEVFVLEVTGGSGRELQDQRLSDAQVGVALGGTWWYRRPRFGKTSWWLRMVTTWVRPITVALHPWVNISTSRRKGAASSKSDNLAPSGETSPLLIDDIGNLKMLNLKHKSPYIQLDRIATLWRVMVSYGTCATG